MQIRNKAMQQTTIHSQIPQDKRTSCEQWQRVMGYYRPVVNWNKGKQQEYKDRVMFKVPA